MHCDKLSYDRMFVKLAYQWILQLLPLFKGSIDRYNFFEGKWCSHAGWCYIYVYARYTSGRQAGRQEESLVRFASDVRTSERGRF